MRSFSLPRPCSILPLTFLLITLTAFSDVHADVTEEIVVIGEKIADAEADGNWYIIAMLNRQLGELKYQQLQNTGNQNSNNTLSPEQQQKKCIALTRSTEALCEKDAQSDFTKRQRNCQYIGGVFRIPVGSYSYDTCMDEANAIKEEDFAECKFIQSYDVLKCY